MTTPGATEFAPAHRATPETIRRQTQLLASLDVLQQVFEAVSEILVILNPERQIVFCNDRFASLLGALDPSRLYGLRPGEALNCAHACEGDGGCGTTRFCTMCGAAQAILASQGPHARWDVRECRILRNPNGEALDLLVRTTPLRVRDERFTILAVMDVSHEKRRRVLERVFFHDVMNTATGILMLSQHLAGVELENRVRDMESRRGGEKEESPRPSCSSSPLHVSPSSPLPSSRVAEMAQGVLHASHQLVEEITGQRDLMSAESHELPVRPLPVSTMALLRHIADTYAHFGQPRGCKLVVDLQSQDLNFITDATIISRVLGNLVKNALEASSASDTVTLGAQGADGGVQLWVHNPGFMPREVQLQVFKRSFSTKGSGRGLGTYSIKLLTEQYLRGKVSFTTSPESGTRFTVWYPMMID